MKLTCKVNTSDFDRKMALFKRAKKGGMKEAVQKASAAYARTALLYTPPGIKSKQSGEKGRVIGEKLYFRPLVFLPDMAKKGKLKDGDREALKNGMLFKLYFKQGDTLKGKYYKSAREAEPERRIATRGLYKSGYSINFPSIGMKTPPAARALARKSPKIQSMAPQMNQLRQQEEESAYTLRIRNSARTDQKISKGESFEDIVIRQAGSAARRTLLRLTRKFFKEKNIKL